MKDPDLWYSEALEVLQPLRWHLNELTTEIESYNRFAAVMGKPPILVNKIKAAKDANEAANKFFSNSK